MNLNKYFPLTFHAILACFAVGLAVGAHEDGHFSQLVQCGLIGLSAGLGLTAFLRVLLSIS